MKVFVVDPSMFTAPYDIALQSGLHAAGAEVRLFGRVPRFAGEFDGAQNYHPFFYRLSEGRLPGAVKHAAKAAEHLVGMGRFAALCRRERPDVVHFQWAPLPIVDSLFIPSIAKVAATVLTVHDTTPFNGNATSRLQVLHTEECWRKFDHLITHTESGRRSLVARGFQPQRIATVPHGLLQTDRPEPKTDSHAASTLNILFFGQIKPYKGLDTLVDSIALLPHDTQRRVRLRVCGQAFMDMAPIHARVEAAGLADIVDFRLERIPDSDVDALFTDADVIAMPYHRIDASGVLSKALAHGVAVVASDTGGFAEFLTHRENALLCKVGDAQDFGRAIMDLATDAALLTRLRASADRLGKDTASWPDIGARTVELYQQVIARRSRTAENPAQTPHHVVKPR
jgi:glycosyltransferase involved in cell wall biosynthesis